MKMNSKMMKDHSGTIAAVGATVAALAAGSYYFFGPKGKQHRHSMKGWMLKTKAEVIEKMEQAKELTQPVYNEIVDMAAQTRLAEGVAKSEVVKLAGDLKKQWTTFSKLMPKMKKAVGIKRSTKKTSAKGKSKK